jgi:hypothetical protein
MNDDVPTVFRYQPVRAGIQMSWLFLAGIFLIVLMASPLTKGPGRMALLVALGSLWGPFYAVRRLLSPWTLEVDGDLVRATFLIGNRRAWKLDELMIRTPRFGSIWEGSTVVTTSRNGRVAFRVFRDLIGYDKFRLLVQGAA